MNCTEVNNWSEARRPGNLESVTENLLTKLILYVQSGKIIMDLLDGITSKSFHIYLCYLTFGHFQLFCLKYMYKKKYTCMQLLYKIILNFIIAKVISNIESNLKT